MTVQTDDKLPNLLVIGAQKAGSTWLHERLDCHPDIFMSQPKELRFFGHRDKTDSPAGLAAYRQHFTAGANARYRGESTPAYFWSHDPDSAFAVDLQRSNLDIPEAVHRLLGHDIPLVLSLRNPISRAISAFYHHYKAGDIQREDTIRSTGHRFGIVDMGFYRRHIESWLRYFSREQLHIVLFDDIVKKPHGVVEDLYRFLGLRTDISDPLLRQKSNQGAQLEQGTGPGIRTADIQFLADLYRNDVDYLEILLDRSLAQWRSKRLQDYISHT
ncbi:MAG: sulfotransferase domain-containing protein [Halioglobus sp.]